MQNDVVCERALGILAPVFGTGLRKMSALSETKMTAWRSWRAEICSLLHVVL
jgi:hypothetical protein